MPGASMDPQWDPPFQRSMVEGLFCLQDEVAWTGLPPETEEYPVDSGIHVAEWQGKQSCRNHLADLTTREGDMWG